MTYIKSKIIDWIERSVPKLTWHQQTLHKLIVDKTRVRRMLFQHGYFAEELASNKAEMEIAILTCAVLSTHKSDNLHAKTLAEVESDIIAILRSIACSCEFYHIDDTFLRKRMREYQEDINSSISERATELPYKSYHYLFNQPLSEDDVNQHIDDADVIKFKSVLSEIVERHNSYFGRFFKEDVPFNFYHAVGNLIHYKGKDNWHKKEER
jgi:hypothetical protein